MIKEIVKRIGVDSLEVAEAISENVTDCIVDEIKEYLELHYESLNSKDIDVILDNSKWWNDLLEDLMDKLKM